MGGQRRRFSADFKAKVALEAIREQHTINELASEYGVHPNLIREWKKHLLSELPQVFSSRKAEDQRTLEEERDRLFQQIGQLQYELAWLKKKLAWSIEHKRSAIEVDESRLSVRRQCDLLGLSRGSWHYRSMGESEENLQLMRLLDEQYTRTPYYGVLRMTAWLQRQGYAVNDKRVRRLLRTMGLMAIYPGPKTSQPAPYQKIYPYLLRGVAITQPDFVWSTDITYIRLAHGFVYLVPIMDWYSRFVLAWRLSKSLETHFCVEALDRALAGATPHIFTSDQGAQFTSAEFTSRLDQRRVRISMGGRGRALDNVNALAPLALCEMGGGIPQLLSIGPRCLAGTPSLLRLLPSRAASALLWDMLPQRKCMLTSTQHLLSFAPRKILFLRVLTLRSTTHVRIHHNSSTSA